MRYILKGENTGAWPSDYFSGGLSPDLKEKAKLKLKSTNHCE